MGYIWSTGIFVGTSSGPIGAPTTGVSKWVMSVAKLSRYIRPGTVSVCGNEPLGPLRYLFPPYGEPAASREGYV